MAVAVAARRAGELVTSAQYLLYCFPREDALMAYFTTVSPRFVDLSPAVENAIVTALTRQLAQRKLTHEAIGVVVTIAARRCITQHAPDMPKHHVKYVIDHYITRAVRFAVSRTPSEPLPPMCLDAHFSQTGIFVME